MRSLRITPDGASDAGSFPGNLITRYARYIRGTQDEPARAVDDILTPIPFDLKSPKSNSLTFFTIPLKTSLFHQRFTGQLFTLLNMRHYPCTWD